MAIPRKQREFFVSLMEATGHGDTSIIYEVERDAYHGDFNLDIAYKLKAWGAILLVEGDLGHTVMINERSDFLSGFAAGVNAARNGDGLYYSDYCSNPYSFNCGYEHYQWRAKKCQRRPYDESTGYVCHGFRCDESDSIYKQDQ
jgi:hypothetical protein